MLHMHCARHAFEVLLVVSLRLNTLQKTDASGYDIMVAIAGHVINRTNESLSIYFSLNIFSTQTLWYDLDHMHRVR
jgi:hypothetical protein